MNKGRTTGARPGGYAGAVLAAGLILALAACAPPAKRASTHAAATAPTSPPRRIVSLNPCVDATLMEVADPTQIAAISQYSHDPRATSIPIALARRFPAVAASADEIIAARPDLVIAGPHVAVPTLAALDRLHIPVLSIGVPDTIAENRAQIMTIATQIGRPERGAALNRRIDAALATSAPPPGTPPVRSLIWQSGGLVPGAGTLADDLQRRAGLHNISKELGLKKWDRLGLENLLLDPPNLLLAGASANGAGRDDSQANRMLTHPALKRALAAAKGRIVIADYPSDLLHCGGPVVIRASQRLAHIRSAYERLRR